MPPEASLAVVVAFVSPFAVVQRDALQVSDEGACQVIFQCCSGRDVAKRKIYVGVVGGRGREVSGA